ncbi:molybdopterin molybdotransferase MoeA [Pseudoprimorskyibacter insulae]|uniref:Molybdopterin molybdenumtransferase n=1 Tax=Pseudoprimorskyibacter insulae TaxID=1695997 RepID=A0A2R8AXF1_9RHOB|nr:gephyrin-like molybdotransferase Glp [Pseudoprimorskyibacter insulae]SPF80731.1 Molybdopterin molybdenumtransferase [Pseudoprimorskyibacter insulae]
MISVTEALDHLFALAAPLGVEEVPLIQAAGRVLARDVLAKRTQPPFPASAMDGYAVVSATNGQTMTVIGESAAGHGFDGAVGDGQAVRIFTGAPVPTGATRVVIQEDVTRSGDMITINSAEDSSNIRPAGTDFAEGTALRAPRILGPNDVALMAAMNIDLVPVARRPKVALISTGDELVMPGEVPGPDQIIASNTFGLHALLAANGAEPRILPIARDNAASLKTAFRLTDDADLVITIGGASVGDHDLVADVAADLGMERAFYKVAMRPGKPLMSGRLNGKMMMGLPGNPVSAMVCGHVFVLPVVRAMLGLGKAPAARMTATLAEPIDANGPREHYMRAVLGATGIRSFERQDSSLLSVLGQANALLIRPPHDPAQAIGATVPYLPI